MPLSDHEQHILDEIEKRLAQEDPRLVEQVGRTSLYSHLARRIRLSAVAFFVGFFLIFLVQVNVVVAVSGFIVMVLSALLIYRYLKQLGRDQLVREARRLGLVKPGERLFIVRGIPAWRKHH